MLNRTANACLAVAAVAIGTIAVVETPAVAQDSSSDAAAAGDSATVDQLIADLDDESASARDAAEEALVALGEAVRPLLADALASESAEVRRRARSVITRLDEALARKTGADLTWAGLRGDPMRSGVAGGELPETEPTEVWSVRLPDVELLQGSVVPAEDRVVILSADGVVRSFATDTGKREWLTNVDATISASAVLAADRLIVPTSTGLIAVDARTGRRAWEAPAIYGCDAAPAIVGGRVYAAFRNEAVRAFDLKTGDKVFERKLSPSGALLADEDLVVVGTEDGHLMRLDAETGKTLWRRDLGSAPDMGPTLASPGLIVVLAENRYLRTISADRGRVAWEVRVSARSHSESLAASAGRVFLTDARGSLRAYEAGSGRALWNRNEGFVTMGGPCATPDRVLASSRGRLVCREADCGDLVWRLDLPSHDNAVPVVADGTIYVLTDEALRALR